MRIDHETLQLAVQYLNHYATPGPPPSTPKSENILLRALYSNTFNI
jgi:hypothetical protein